MAGSYVRTPEIRAKQSAAVMGKKNHQYGKPRSAETKSKLSAALRGRVFSDEHRAKLSAAETGEKSRWLGKPAPNRGVPCAEETKAKISASAMGRITTDETRAKISAANRGRVVSENTRNMMRGENNPAWKGGTSFGQYCPKWNKDLRNRIRAFFDNQCLMCGKTPGMGEKSLCCHHVTYNKKMCCDGQPVRFAALCHRHHVMTNHGDRERWAAMFRRVIEEVYGGRSYYTRDEYKMYLMNKEVDYGSQK